MSLASERKKGERERYRRQQEQRRQAERAERERKKRRLEQARAMCKENAKHAREVAKDVYKREQQAIRERRKRTVRSAAEGCRGSKAQIRQSADRAIATSKALRAEERRIRAELARTEAHARKLARSKATPAQRRSESDQSAEHEIAPGDRALWRQVKGSIKSTSRKSRAEAFQQYVEENPGEAIRARESAADRQWKREVAERYREEARARRA